MTVSKYHTVNRALDPGYTLPCYQTMVRVRVVGASDPPSSPTIAGFREWILYNQFLVTLIKYPKMDTCQKYTAYPGENVCVPVGPAPGG